MSREINALASKASVCIFAIIHSSLIQPNLTEIEIMTFVLRMFMQDWIEWNKKHNTTK